MDVQHKNAKAEIQGHLKKCKRCGEWQPVKTEYYPTRGVCKTCGRYMRRGLSLEAQLAERRGLPVPASLPEPEIPGPETVVLPQLSPPLEVLNIDVQENADEGEIPGPEETEKLRMLGELAQSSAKISALEAQVNGYAEVLVMAEKNEDLLMAELERKDREIAALKAELLKRR